MIKNIRKSVLLSGILFSLLVISSFFPSYAVALSAVETDGQNKTIDVLNDVIGINTTGFITDLNSQSTEQYQGLEKNTFDITMISTRGQLRISSSFVNGDLHQIYICNYDGNLAVEASSSDTVEMVRTLLGNYENYVEDSFYGRLVSMLDNVDGSKDATKSEGNVKLDIKSSETITTYLWTYMDENGILAKAKKVLVSYEEGQLKVFRNDWPLYTVVSAPTVSGEEATKIAIEASKSFTYEVCSGNGTEIISGFEISQESLGNEVLSYLNNPNQTLARDNDPFTLYPSWYVPLGFNTSYPGALTGMVVAIWADTGEVSGTNPTVLYLPHLISAAEQEKTLVNEQGITNEISNGGSALTIYVGFVATLCVFGASAYCKKIGKFTKGKKLISNFGTILFCGMLAISTISMASYTVNAEVNPDSVSRIYAALDGGNGSPAQSNDEKAAAYEIAAHLEDAFDDEGYSAYDMAGADTTKSLILYYAKEDEDDFDHATIFHFGHEYVSNGGYVDNNGTGISASEIDAEIDSNKYEFVFIFVCDQAQSTSPSGTAAAWTNRTDVFDQLSSNGYDYPDGDDQCYIGFDYYSPMISLTNGTFYEDQTTGPFKKWVKSFYDYALDECLSVNDALDNACLDFFGVDFDSSILDTGNNAWWPGMDIPLNSTGEKDFDEAGWYPIEYYDPPTSNNTMRVFGDGEIGISQPSLTVSAGTGGWVNPSGTNRYTYGYQAMASANAYANYDFSHWNLDGQYYSSNQVVTVNMYDDHSLQAIFSYNPPTYALGISVGTGGTTSPSPGTHYYSSGTPVQVTAYPNANYDFDHWSLDGNTYYSNPITVTMNTNHNLQAYFSYDPPTYPLTVNAYAIGQGAVYVPVYLDGDYVGTTMNTYYVTVGTHSVSVPYEPNPYLTLAYWVGLSGGTVNVQGSTTVTAYYTFHGK